MVIETMRRAWFFMKRIRVGDRVGESLGFLKYLSQQETNPKIKTFIDRNLQQLEARK